MSSKNAMVPVVITSKDMIGVFLAIVLPWLVGFKKINSLSDNYLICLRKTEKMLNIL